MHELSSPSHDPRGQRGFSMFLVIMAMFVTSMFVAFSFAAINADFVPSAQSKARKSSYAAAEAGLGYYLKQLRSNPDAWTECATVAAPNAAEKSPINQQWDGVGIDTRTWRKLPGVDDQYTIELLHTPRFAQCDPTKQESVVDMSSGTFRVRVSGRSSPTDKYPRSIVATFMRDGFLKFVWFTDQENQDPQAAANASDRDAQQKKCVDKNRTARDDNCVEIQFQGNDGINGPMHTNDESFAVCGNPTFGREKSQDGTETIGTDAIEVSGKAPGYVKCSAGAVPEIWSLPTNAFTPFSDNLPMPDSNQDLVTVADSAGKSYKGKTIVRLNNNTMDVTNYATGSAVTTFGVPWPGNGVLYVKNNGACNGEFPTDADYNEGNACGNIYVSGTYSKPLTIGAANDVIVRPTNGAKLLASSKDSDIKRDTTTDAMLGLIANNFVRVGHRVSNCNNYSSTQEPLVTNVQIDAAIMSLQHSFIVDNYNCGRAGTLTVNGAIVQRYRGPVGTGSGNSISTGFVKNYWYDDRLRYRSPPYFLSPLKAKWEVQETQEQVKGSPST